MWQEIKRAEQKDKALQKTHYKPETKGLYPMYSTPQKYQATSVLTLGREEFS